MTAQVVPFPRARNRPHVMRHAHYVALVSEHAGERYLLQQINVQRQTMLRRGVAPQMVERECRAIEAAIRTALWNIVMRQPEGIA
jgi:hypothetical protein